jgi:hypothetical protein
VLYGATQGELRYDPISTDGPEAISAFARENYADRSSEAHCHEPTSWIVIGFTPRDFPKCAQPEIFGLQSSRKRLSKRFYQEIATAYTDGNSFLRPSSMERAKTRGKEIRDFLQGIRPLGARVVRPTGLERHAGLRLFATLAPEPLWLDVWLMVAMEVAIRDDRGLLKQAAGRDVEGEPDELGVRPIQGGGREGGSARCKARLAGWRLVIPDLLGQ